MITNNFFTIKNNKHAQRAIAWLLIALMIFGMVPNLGVTTAQAAESLPAVNLSDLIDKNGGSVTIPVTEKMVGPVIKSKHSPGGTAGYLAEYDTSGVHGYGYCLQHWLGANNGMNVTISDAKKANGLLANVFYLGYTDDSRSGKAQFVTDLATLADTLTQEAGKGSVLSPDWATWLKGLPDDKANEYWRKATQIAVWMATDTAGGKPNMIVEDQLVYKDGTVKSAYSDLENDGYDRIKNSENDREEAQYVLKGAKALYLVASYFTAKGFDISQREAKMVTYPIQRDVLADNSFYSGDTIDFKDAGMNPGEGNIVNAYEDLGGSVGVVENNGFYEIYYMTVSATQFSGVMNISIADTSQNLPSGTILKGLTVEDCLALGIDEDFAFPDKSGQEIGLVMKKSNLAPSNYTEAGFGEIDQPMSGDYDENRKINFPCYYKLCIPTSSVNVDDTTPVSIDIDVKCTSLYKYDLYKGTNNSSNLQDFALGDTVAADTNHNSVVWAGAESVINPILEKKTSDGNVLSGVTFKFDGPSTKSFTTDSSGKIFAQWTDSSASNYLAPGTYTVTETSVQAGYIKDPSVKTITLNADGSSSGMLTFTNTIDPHNPEGVIKKISTTGIGLAGAVFEFTTSSGAGGGTYTSNSDGVVPIQWTDKNKPNYIAPGTYMVKEITPPPGYNLDSGGAQQITLYADGKVSGELTFVNSKKPSLLIYKSDENGKPLPGAVFTVWKDGQEMGTVGPTGADGYAEIENVENGHYEFQEYTAPAGYLLSTEKKGINVDVNSIVGEMAVNVVSFKNSRDISISLLKIDDSGNGLPGAVIEVMIDGEMVGQFKTGTDGSVTIPYDQIKGHLDMSKDSWTAQAREVSPPSGYLLNNDDWQTVEIHRGENPEPFVFVDSIYPHIEIRKVDRGSNTGLDGAKFEVKIDGATLGTYTTENGGKIIIDYATYERFLGDLNNPDHTWLVSVREVAAPDGYLIDDINWQEQKLSLGQTLEPFVFVDTKYPDIEIYKLDRGTNTGLEGAMFEVKIDDHTIGTFPTDKDGRILIDYETYKRFLGDITNPEKKAWTIAVREVAAPDGFLIDDDNWQMQELILGQSLAPFIFTDSEYGDIIIRKLERGTIKGLEGAVFEVMIDTTKIGEYHTNKFGEILISYEEYERFLGDLADSDKDKNAWTVHVREVVPPDGYLLDDEEWHVAEYRIGEKVKPFVFTDTKYPDIMIMKLDNGTKEGLDGAVFQLTINGTMVDEFVTENGGIIKVTYDTYGRYLGDQTNPEQIEWTIGVREVSAPDGYLIDDDNWHYGQLKIGEKLETFVFTDTKYPDIKIIKLDRETGERLPNTSFRIAIDGTSFIAEKKTDENGEIIITYEEYKHFLTESGDKDRDMWTITVTELEPTQFYNKDKQQTSGDYTQTQQLKHGQSLSVFEFKDTHFRDIKVYKYDSETNWLLKGATFRLHCLAAENDDAGNITDRELTTDEKGYVIFENIPNGTYELTEISAPFGYENNGEKKTVIVTSDSDRVIEFDFKNAPKSGLMIRKIDSVTKQPIANVRFKITPLAPLNLPAWEDVTDDNGLIVKENLPAGTYRIEEVSTVDGYVKNDTPQEIEINNQHDAYTVTFENNQKNMLNILKLDAITGEPLPGAIFEVSTAGGTHIANVITGAFGYGSLPNLKPGSYVVKEVQAPEGHIIDPTIKTFEITNDDSGQVITLIFNNSPYTDLYIRKYDALTNIGLEGGHFKVWKDNTLIADDVVSDAAGFIHIGEQTAGMFQIQEIRAPKGYILDSTIRTIYLKDGETGTIEIPNEKPGGLAIHKTDAKTGEALAGATFELRTIDGKLISSKVTGKDGYARWEQLEPGWYVVTETGAPDGYVVTNKSMNVEIKEFESTVIEWIDDQNTSLTIVKRDKDTEVPLAGAIFEICTMSGDVVERVKSSYNKLSSHVE